MQFIPQLGFAPQLNQPINWLIGWPILGASRERKINWLERTPIQDFPHLKALTSSESRAESRGSPKTFETRLRRRGAPALVSLTKCWIAIRSFKSAVDGRVNQTPSRLSPSKNKYSLDRSDQVGSQVLFRLQRSVLRVFRRGLQFDLERGQLSLQSFKKQRSHLKKKKNLEYLFLLFNKENGTKENCLFMVN